MFLALRELAFARARFILMGAVVALISVLMVLLSGLSVGLVNDGVSGLQRLPVSAFAFKKDVDTSAAFTRSTVTLDEVESWSGQPNVEHAEPFGLALVNGRSGSGVEIDLALFGVREGSVLDPSEVPDGAPVADEGEVVLSATAAEEGIVVGDVIALEPSGMELTVVGILGEQHTFGHVDVGYVRLSTWQQAKAGIRPGEPMPDRLLSEITAVALVGDDIDTAAGDEAVGTTTLTLTESYGASPGYTAETSTLQLIQVFLYAISALVVGAFFTVMTIQRKQEIAVLRAMGASTGHLLKDSLVQSLILLVVSTAVGIGIGLAAGAGLATTSMPFALEAGPVATAAVLMVVLGLAGAAIAVRRVTKVDPLTALGASR